MSDLSLQSSSLNTSETPSPQDAQVVGGHTPTPWRVGYTGRCIIKEVPGLSDSDDGYTVAVLTAHSLLPNSEAKANAAFIVRACNSHDALVKALDTFLGGDDRFRVAVGGNPIAVDQMIADARAILLSARGVQ